jgi:hypothetical protein
MVREVGIVGLPRFGISIGLDGRNGLGMRMSIFVLSLLCWLASISLLENYCSPKRSLRIGAIRTRQIST